MGISMKCPNCGAELSDGMLCCEKCGSDIHMVPDYEPDLEDSITQSIGENLGEQHSLQQKWVEKTGKKCCRPESSHFVLTALCVCFFGLIVAVSLAILVFVRYYSYDYQIQKAIECTSKSKFDDAIDHYERAIYLDETDIEAHFALAEIYMKQGNKIVYEYTLRNIIKNPLCTQEQLERAYGKLIAIYDSRKEYDIINEILRTSENEDIISAYRSYLAEPPQFNYEPGYYNKAVPLKLTSATTGSIYYTLDGSEPDRNSLLYTAPILLDQMDIVVKAVFVNDYGIVSEVIEGEFDVVINMEEAPQLSIIGGEYFTPMMIEVVDNLGKDVYYTTDGSIPSRHSILYTGPIPMPLGESRYRFAYVQEDGSSSEIAERRFKLTLKTDITVEDAEALVVEYMLILKKILLEDGTFSDTSKAKYLYDYQYVINLEEFGVFYVVAEIYRDEDGVQNKTGSYYAVNAYKKECYKLLIDEKGNYTLITINLDSH